MRILAAVAKPAPTDETPAEQNVKVSVADLTTRNKAGPVNTWQQDQQQAIEELTNKNRFMLGLVERKRDEYDVDYDKGKVKKVKSKKEATKFNFDKQEKRLKQARLSGAVEAKPKKNKYFKRSKPSN